MCYNVCHDHDKLTSLSPAAAEIGCVSCVFFAFLIFVCLFRFSLYVCFFFRNMKIVSLGKLCFTYHGSFLIFLLFNFTLLQSLVTALGNTDTCTSESLPTLVFSVYYNYNNYHPDTHEGISQTLTKTEHLIIAPKENIYSFLCGRTLTGSHMKS